MRFPSLACTFHVAFAAVLAACGGSETPVPGGTDASTLGDATTRHDGASDGGECPSVASYCSVQPVPPECMNELSKIEDLCTSAPLALVHVTATTCPGIVAVYEQGVDASTLFYFDSAGSLAGVNHTGLGGAECSAAGPGFTPPDGMGHGCAATGTPMPACVDAG